MCDASNQLDFADEQFSTVMSRHSLTLPPYMGGDSGGGGGYVDYLSDRIYQHSTCCTDIVNGQINTARKEEIP